MKYIILILSTTLLISAEMEVDGNLKVTGRVESTTIDSLNNKIANLELIIAQLQTQINNLLINGDCDSNELGIQLLDTCGICGGMTTDIDDCDYALSFDGGDDEIKIITDDFLGGNNPRSISVWAYHSGQSANSGNIISLGSGMSHNSRFSINIRQNNQIIIVGQGNDYETNVYLNDNAWTHLVLTKDATHVYLYKNGSLADQHPVSYNTDSNQPIMIGTNTDDRNDEYFIGFIDEVLITNDVLNADEVLSIYNQENIELDNLVGYWKFNEASGIIVNDSSLNGNNGTIFGATWVQSNK